MFLLLKEKLVQSVAEAAKVDLEEASRSIGLPKGQFGDVASSIAFVAAKREKKSPAALAMEIAGRMRLPDWVEFAKAEGPYINFLLSESFFTALVSKALGEKENFGRRKKHSKRTIVEFPSVNPNKPWHIGHLRNALLGDAVARILDFSGENVERTDYIDDLGLQVAQSFWGYLNMGKKPAGKIDLWLGEQYVEVSKRFETDEKVQKEVRELLKKMEHGNDREAKECRKLVESCVASQYETAFKFGIYHDVLIFESDILRTIFKEGMELLKSSPAIVKETEGKNAGCLVAKMTSAEFANMESPDKILVRSDGTATYTGKDVIFQLWKFGKLKNDFTYSKFMHQPTGHDCYMSEPPGSGSDKGVKFGHADRVINVIGMEQAYPQKVISEILRSMGYGKEADNSVHLAYEHVGLAEAKFSGRQGTWIGFTTDELYSEGLVRAEAKIKPEVEGADRGRIATAVASAAIRFSFLKTTPEKRITFHWDDALSMEGDSAPYAMYAHARACKIAAKAGEGTANAPIHALTLSEKELLLRIMAFDLVISDAARQMRPHIVAEYCLSLATSYNKFYNTSPIIACEDEQKKAMRLSINSAALVAMKNALRVIGIEPLESM
ncbi:MAG: arginine--tRNA ligase [Candidatus Micrarchaeia archaeon]